VHAHGEQARTLRLVLEASAQLLDAMAAGSRDLRGAQIRLHDALGAVVKASRESALERRLRLHREAPTDMPAGMPTTRGLQIVQLGFDVLAAALAAEGHAPAGEPRPPLEALRGRLEALRPTSSSSAKS
jgi:hypothetical protein